LHQFEKKEKQDSAKKLRYTSEKEVEKSDIG
jgi:hypothetical protein